MKVQQNAIDAFKNLKNIDSDILGSRIANLSKTERKTLEIAIRTLHDPQTLLTSYFKDSPQDVLEKRASIAKLNGLIEKISGPPKNSEKITAFFHQHNHSAAAFASQKIVEEIRTTDVHKTITSTNDTLEFMDNVRKLSTLLKKEPLTESDRNKIQELVDSIHGHLYSQYNNASFYAYSSHQNKIPENFSSQEFELFRDSSIALANKFQIKT